jgi:hypothetical protein
VRDYDVLLGGELQGSEISANGAYPILPYALAWDGSKWSELPKPPLPAESIAGWLDGVTCLSATNCIAVGRHYVVVEPISGWNRAEYLAMHWNGKSWSQDSVPADPQALFLEGTLSDVSCISTSDCFAVGGGTLHWNGEAWSYGPSKSIGIERISCRANSFCMGIDADGEFATIWNGEEWSSFSISMITQPDRWPLIMDVSCANSWSCSAVGLEGGAGLENYRRIALHWDGGEWVKEAVSNPAEKGSLEGVSCTSSSHCLTVGTNGFYESARIETYDHSVAAPQATTEFATGLGTASATLNGTINGGSLPTTYYFEYDTSEYKSAGESHGVKSPAPSKSIGSVSGNVSVAKPIEGLKGGTTYHYRVVATNVEGTAYGKDQTFTTWGSWSLKSTPNPALPPNPANKASLETVSCPSSSLCLAAGYDSTSGNGFGQRWTGSEWKADAGLKSLPIAPRGISCPSTTSCSVVGSTGSGSSSLAAAETWFYYSGAWYAEELAVPKPEGGTYVKLNDVSCTSESACTAVGSFEKEGKTRTLAARWNGTSWSLQATANPESGGAELLGVSCDSASSCTAVGKAGTKTFAERWNGTSWSISSTPNPSPSVESTLEDVSCTSSTNCLAVGGYRQGEEGGESNKKTLTERWNGTSWSIVSSPNPSGNYGASLLDLACTSSSNCAAVGRYVSAATYGLEGFPTEEKTLVESWNGTGWAVQSSPNPEGRKFSKLLGVACSASNSCKAVGSGKGSDTVTLGEGYE